MEVPAFFVGFKMAAKKDGAKAQQSYLTERRFAVKGHFNLKNKDPTQMYGQINNRKTIRLHLRIWTYCIVKNLDINAEHKNVQNLMYMSVEPPLEKQYLFSRM